MEGEPILESAKPRPSAQEWVLLGAMAYGAVMTLCIFFVMTGVVLESGGHTGSDMALLAESMQFRCAGSILLLGAGGFSIFYAVETKKHVTLLFVIGVILGLLATIPLVSVVADFGALENASRCGTYDVCY